MKARWKEESDGTDTWWEADVKVGSVLINIMVDEDGYTIADGGGASIMDVTGRKGEKISDLCAEATNKLQNLLIEAASDVADLCRAAVKKRAKK